MKKVLILIFILSILDIVLTYTGIKLNLIEEANPLLRSIFHTAPEIVAVAVVGLTGSIMWLINRYGNKLKHINSWLAVILTVKIYIMYVHFKWIRFII